MKLFVTDYDGTLFVNDKQMKSTVKKLKKLREHGFDVVIATGRIITSITNQTQIHNIPYDYIICADGSVIYDNNGNIIEKFCIKKDIIKPFEKFYQNLNYEEIQFTYPEYYSNILRDDNDNLLGINVCLSTDNYKQDIVDQFKIMSKDFPTYNFLDYMHPNFSYLCVKPKGVSKSFAINDLRKKKRILKKDVFVIGDAANDYEMIKDFKGVCVWDSTPDIIKIAKKRYKNINYFIDDILKED